MTYHDLNRLTAHLEIKLTATQLAVSKELASSLSASNGLIQLPASHLAKVLNRTPKTIETALRTLLELGIYTATRPGSHRARVYQLAISCPENCLKLQAHNSPARLKKLKLTSKSYPQESELTSKNSKVTSNHYRTNRDIYIDDIELQLSKTLDLISELLFEAGELTKDQAKLHSYLTSKPEAITAKVKHLANHYQVKQLKPWLKQIINTNPRKLFIELEQPAISSRQALKDKKQEATIYSSKLEASTRINLARLEIYCQEIIGFKLTATSSSYLLKRGKAITWRDLQLAKLFETMANKPEIKNLNPSNPLRLELIDNQITISYLDLDSVSFNISNLEQDNWQILTASELEANLEAEKLEQELRANLEAQGYNWRRDTSGSYGQGLATIRQQYPTITPVEAGRRFTQAVSEQLAKFHRATPEAPAEPDLYPDLNTWITSNYTQEADYLELMEHYPEKPESHTWSETAGFRSYLEAEKQGLTWEQLASSMDHYRNNLGTKWPKAPNTWINEQIDRYQQAKAKSGERTGQARSLESILAGIEPPKTAL